MEKKIPVFVSKFGENFFFFKFPCVIFLSFYRFFFPKRNIVFAERGRAEGTTQNIYHYGNWCFREE